LSPLKQGWRKQKKTEIEMYCYGYGNERKSVTKKVSDG